MTDQPKVEFPAKIFAAILQVKKHLAAEGVAKAQKNQQQGYAFRGIDDIMNAMAAPLVNAGIIVVPRVNFRTQTVDVVKSSSGKDQRITSVALDTDFLFIADDGSSVTARIQSEASDYADKATNKAISFGMKYAFISVFNIPVVGADDGDFESPGNDAERPAVAGKQQDVATAPQKKAAKGKAAASKANGAAAPVDPKHPVIVRLKKLDQAVGDKLATLLQKAYNVDSVTKIPEAKHAEAIARVDGYLSKQMQAKPAASKAAADTADDIPE